MHGGITYNAAVITAADHRMNLGVFAYRSSDIAGNSSVNTSAGDSTAIPTIYIAYFNICIVPAGINAAIYRNIDIAGYIAVVRAAVNIFGSRSR